jgi:hypothetical protein
VKILGEGQLKNSSAISQRLAKYEYLPYIWRWREAKLLLL